MSLTVAPVANGPCTPACSKYPEIVISTGWPAGLPPVKLAIADLLKTTVNLSPVGETLKESTGTPSTLMLDGTHCWKFSGPCEASISTLRDWFPAPMLITSGVAWGVSTRGWVYRGAVTPYPPSVPATHCHTPSTSDCFFGYT